MKNFDEARAARLSRDEDELTFELGGETFVLKPAVRVDVWVAYWDIWGRFSAMTNREQLAAMDSHVKLILEADYGDAWDKVRRIDGPMAVTFGDIVDVISFAWTAQTARPTGEPSGSSPSPDQPTTSSTPASPSPA